MASGYTAISASAARVDLDVLFKQRTSAAIADTGFKVNGTDISDRYEPSVAEEDRISFNVYYKKGGVDISTLFMDYNYADMLQYLLTVVSGSGSGNKNSGSLAPISASAAPLHYHFDVWIGDSITSPTSANTTVLMDADKSVTASFAVNQWTLTVTNGTGDGTFEYFADMPITASAPPSYKTFNNWNNPVGDLSFVNSGQSQTIANFTDDGNATAEAVYNWITYYVTPVTTTGGLYASINGDGSGDPVPLTNNDNYGWALECAPDDYYSFTNWSGDTTGIANVNAASTTMAVTQNATVNANFAPTQYTITMQKDAGITSTTPSVGNHNYIYTDFPVNASATVEWDYDFAHWELDSVNVGGSAGSYNITGIGNHTLKATSALKNVAFTLADDGHGSPTADYSQYPSVVPIHTTVTVTGNPDTGYSFTSLTADNDGEVTGYTCKLEGLGLTTITAHYTINQYTLTVVDGTGGGEQNYGYEYNLTADSKTGFTFANWSGTGVSFGSPSNTTTTATIGAFDRTATANFNANNYTLTVANGDVTGGGTAEYVAPNGYQYSIYADDVPTGYSWGGWETNSGTVSYANQNAMDTTCYIGAANADITATYDINQYTLTVTWGTGGGSANYGNTYNISATDYEPAYTFTNWETKVGSITYGDANDPTTTATIGAANATTEAIYTANNFTLTVVDGTGGGSAAYEDPNGHVYTITADDYEPAWTFTNWSGAGCTFGNASSITTSCTIGAADATATANYIEN
jgi:hypothetical protein